MRGISPLVATVLLIAMVVLIATIISNWASTISKEQTRDVSNQSSELIGCIGTTTIEDVYLDFTSGRGKMFVRTTIKPYDTVKIGTTLVSKTGLEAPNLTALPMIIASGELKSLEFNIAVINMTACVNFSVAKLATNCHSDTSDKAPRNC